MMSWLSTMLFRDLLTWVTTIPGSLRSVCSSPLLHLFPPSLICCRSACTTNVSVSMSFGGHSWPINPLDITVGRINSGRNPLCLGAIFDIDLGGGMPGSSNPSWIIGDTFLVRILSRLTAGCMPLSLSFSFRKTCTRYFVPHLRLLGLPICLLRLVDHVQQDHPARPRRASRLPPLQARLPRALLLPLLGFLVCVPFSAGRSYFLIFPISFKCCYVNHIPFVPDALSYCYHAMSLSRAFLCSFTFMNYEGPCAWIYLKVMIYYGTMHRFSGPYICWFSWYTNAEVQFIIHYLLPILVVVISIQAIHLYVSGANRFDPIDITLYGRQVLITICSDHDIILDSDTTDRFVFVKDIMIDMLRISYICQEMR